MCLSHEVRQSEDGQSACCAAWERMSIVTPLLSADFRPIARRSEGMEFGGVGVEIRPHIALVLLLNDS